VHENIREKRHFNACSSPLNGNMASLSPEGKGTKLFEPL